MATAIFYASNTGNTEDVATKISKELEINDVFDLADININDINNYDKLIFGISTWGEGELQDVWEEVIDDFSKLDFTGKTIAFFGLGDQDDYGDNFLDAMGIVYELVVHMGGEIIGFWDIESYDFDESKALVDGRFIGLGIDEDNQYELTNDRIVKWCEQIKNKIL